MVELSLQTLPSDIRELIYKQLPRITRAIIDTCTADLAHILNPNRIWVGNDTQPILTNYDIVAAEMSMQLYIFFNHNFLYRAADDITHCSVRRTFQHKPLDSVFLIYSAEPHNIKTQSELREFCLDYLLYKLLMFSSINVPNPLLSDIYIIYIIYLLQAYISDESMCLLYVTLNSPDGTYQRDMVYEQLVLLSFNMYKQGRRTNNPLCIQLLRVILSIFTTKSKYSEDLCTFIFINFAPAYLPKEYYAYNRFATFVLRYIFNKVTINRTIEYPSKFIAYLSSDLRPIFNRQTRTLLDIFIDDSYFNFISTQSKFITKKEAKTFMETIHEINY